MIGLTKKLKNPAEKEKFKIPKTVQQSIPITKIFKDGILLCGNLYTKSWKFTDVNYSVASSDDQVNMFLAYSEILNSLAIDATTKITINNRQLNKEEFKQRVWLKHNNDSLDVYRDEINEILLDKMSDSNNLVQEKYVTVSVAKKNIEEARNFFTRIGNDLSAGFNRIASRITPMTSEERLQILHDFYRGSEEQTIELDIKRYIKLGHDVIDFICPDSMEFKSDYFRIGDKYGRVIFLKDFASFIKDSMVSEITDFSRNLMMSVDVLPIPTDDAVKEVQKKILAVETDITRWQQKQNMNNNFSANIPYEMEQMRKELKEFLDDLTTRDQRMMSALITLVHTADTLDKLNEDTETILSIGRKHLCQFATLKFQQEDGLKTVLPYGLRKIDALRTLTTESTAVFMPFKTQEIMDKNGLFYGVNAISHNLILCNRKYLQNGNGWILGVPGSGKSFFAKFEMILNALYNSDDDIIIVDPEGEYAPIIDMLGGERIIISAASNNHINALDMVKDYGDGDNPINVKAQFIMSLYEQIVGAGRVKAQERSIIDRAVAKIYEKYMIDYKGEPPTLVDFHNVLKTFSEPEARDIALAMELFTEGSLNAFAHQSNVNINNRIVCYDILDLGEQLKPVGLLVMLDNIMNRVIANRHKGKYTHIYIDEAHLFFANQFSSEFLARAWKRFRKYGGLITGITQNVSECLASPTAKLMLSNSEFVIMLNQSAPDRAELAPLMNISPTQIGYIDNAPSGQGVMRVGPNIIPFVNRFPTNTQLYMRMTTKPSESKI